MSASLLADGNGLGVFGTRELLCGPGENCGERGQFTMTVQ